MTTCPAQAWLQAHQPTFALAICLALLGHLAFWQALANRVNAVGLPRPMVKGITVICHLVQFGLPCFALLLAWRQSQPASCWLATCPISSAYLLASAAIGVALLPRWLWLQYLRPMPGALVAARSRVHDLSQGDPRRLVSGIAARSALWVPGNQLLEVEAAELRLRLPRLPRALTGLRIALLSDLHASGRVASRFFERAVDLANQFRPDLVAVTGDLCDRDHAMPGVVSALSRLQAGHGVYYVLGNHDLLANYAELHRHLAAAGLIHVGGRWHSLSIHGAALLVAGNELPWFGPEPPESPPALLEAASRDAARPFRLALCHSPDRLAWARRNDVDLVLAGHTHGGQIRLPIVGPISSPSLHGVKYVGGLHAAGPTLMYITRGLSSLLPVRWNCRPELALLTLESDDA